MKAILVILFLVSGTVAAAAQSVDNDLPGGPYAECRDLTPGMRFLCMILRSSYRDPKHCPQIGQYKIVPQSASCERGNDRPPSLGRFRSRDMGGYPDYPDAPE